MSSNLLKHQFGSFRRVKVNLTSDRHQVSLSFSSFCFSVCFVSISVFKKDGAERNSTRACCQDFLPRFPSVTNRKRLLWFMLLLLPLGAESASLAVQLFFFVHPVSLCYVTTQPFSSLFCFFVSLFPWFPSVFVDLLQKFLLSCVSILDFHERF